MQATIADDLSKARGGDLIVGIRDHVADGLEEAAGLFGLNMDADTYHSIDADEAEAVLRAVLHEDMAYRNELVPLEVASALAKRFVLEFASESPKFFTNGSFGKASEAPGVGSSRSPATSATFDTGVLVLTSHKTACAWFMDED